MMLLRRKGFHFGVILIAILSIAWMQRVSAQVPEKNAPDTKKKLRVDTQLEVTEVLLDMVARDKNGKLLRDLKENELEVYEDGVKQKISSFTLVEKRALKLETPTGPAAVATSPLDTLRQINLVTLVFERMDVDGRRLAHEGALQFLKTELGNNVFAAVYVIDQRLMILQSFTNDREKLRTAIEKATTRAYSQWAADSSAVESDLAASAAGLQAAGDSQAGSLGRGATDTAGAASSFIESVLAEAASNSLSFSEAMAREQQSRSSVFSLLSLARSQKNMTGRKTLLYFSEALALTPMMKDYLKTVISEANRANVSIYAIDTRGLITTDQNRIASSMLSDAAAQIRSQMQRPGGPVTYRDMMAGEQGEASIYANFQETMAALSEQTGGKLIANSNDLGVSMKRVSEDIGSYYELAYSPGNPTLDGKFREITVKVLRRGVTVQTRKGYFAVPRTETSSPLVSFELPLLGALSSTPVPHEFDYRAVVLHFDHSPEGVLGSLVLEIPLSQISFRSDRTENKFKARFALLALLKTADGRILQKFSHDYDYQGDLPQLELAKKNHLLFLRHFVLPQGRYHLETVIRDLEADRISARKSIFLVPGTKAGVHMSSLSVIEKIAKASNTDTEDQDPFRLGDSQLLPDLAHPIELAPNNSLKLYFVAYPDQSRPEETQLTLQFLQSGLTVSQAQIDLPPADKSGRIPYLATIPAESLKPGDYEIRAIIAQGDSAVEEYAFLTLVK